MIPKFLKTHVILTHETLLVLWRDQILIPVLLGGFLISLFANLASDWSVEDFRKILFDIGYFGFYFTGSLMAIFWGTKMLADSRQEGSVEVQLAAPVPRVAWLLGKFSGLKLCLFLVTLAFAGLWQVLMLANDFGWLTSRQILLFFFMYLNWVVVAALALWCATMTSQSTAIFCSLAFWLCGLSARSISQTLSPEVADSSRTLVGLIARVWDLQQFNLMDQVLLTGPIPTSETYELAFRLAYGVSLCLIFLSAACLVFKRRDLCSR